LSPLITFLLSSPLNSQYKKFKYNPPPRSPQLRNRLRWKQRAQAEGKHDRKTLHINLAGQKSSPSKTYTSRHQLNRSRQLLKSNDLHILERNVHRRRPFGSPPRKPQHRHPRAQQPSLTKLQALPTMRQQGSHQRPHLLLLQQHQNFETNSNSTTKTKTNVRFSPQPCEQNNTDTI
ncbi:hypothetical protein KC19_7G046600, partial [Ceratodon purpureus]